MLLLSINTAGAAAHDPFHAVQFFETPDPLGRAVAAFLVDGFLSGQPGLVIATAAHRDAILHALHETGIDTEAMQKTGDLRLLDANEALSLVIVHGAPDPQRFTLTALAAMESVRRGRPHLTVRVFTDIASVLRRANQTAAAVSVESLWNHLAAQSRPNTFALFCGHEVRPSETSTMLDTLRDLHSHVVSDDGVAVPTKTRP